MTQATGLPIGTRLQLRDAGEGWFQGVGELRGSVCERVRREDDSSLWYVLRLDEPLEIQETGHDTVSGFRLVRYSVLLTRSRWADMDIGASAPCSVHICLVPERADPAMHLAVVRTPDAWATCTVASDA